MHASRPMRLTALLGAVAIVALMAPQSNAAFAIRVSQVTDLTGSTVVGSSVTIYDQDFVPSIGTLADQNALVEMIDSPSNYAVNAAFVVQRSSASATESVAGSDISSDNFDVTNISGGVAYLMIEVSRTDYDTPDGEVNFIGTGTVNLTVLSGGTVDGTITGYDDDSNTLFGTGPNALALPAVSVTTGAPNYSQNSSTSFSLNAPYTKTIVGIFEVANGTQFDFDANFTNLAVPEPTTLLSALPLLMIGGGLYLRRRKAA